MANGCSRVCRSEGTPRHTHKGATRPKAHGSSLVPTADVKSLLLFDGGGAGPLFEMVFATSERRLCSFFF